MNFAIIGCGFIAETHAQAIKMLISEDVQLTACWDRDPDKADAFAKRHCIGGSYHDLSELLSDQMIDAVCICTPSGTHGEITIAAANAGKHIVCEKPLEITPQRILDIIHTVNTNNVSCQTIMQRRLMPAAIVARAAIAQGHLGRITLAEADLKYYRDNEYFESSGWKGRLALDGGGALMNQGIHGIDLMLWMLGREIRSIYGISETLIHDVEVEDTAAALLQMEDRSICILRATTNAYPGFHSTFAIHGEKGSIVFDDEEILSWDFVDEQSAPPKPKPGEAIGGAQGSAEVAAFAHVEMIKDLVHAVRDGHTPLVPPEETLKAVRTITDIYESARLGDVIRY